MQADERQPTHIQAHLATPTHGPQLHSQMSLNFANTLTDKNGTDKKNINGITNSYQGRNSINWAKTVFPLFICVILITKISGKEMEMLKSMTIRVLYPEILEPRQGSRTEFFLTFINF